MLKKVPLRIRFTLVASLFLLLSCVTLMLLNLNNGLKDLRMKNYQMPMNQRDRIELKMVLTVEQVKKHLR